MFNSLEDLIGGSTVLYLAVNSYIVDITTTEMRTARICFLSAASNLGYMIGAPLGTKIKTAFG